MKKLHAIFVISILIILNSNHVYSYDDVITHPALTDIAVSKSHFAIIFVEEPRD